MPAARNVPTRLGIVAEGAVPPVWITELVHALDSAPFVELVVVVIVPPARERKTSLVGLFGQLDRRLFASADDPFLPSPDLLLTARARVAFVDPGVGDIPRTASLDVVLSLCDGPPPALLDHGAEIWWFDRGGDPPYLADLAQGNPVSTTLLKARAAGDPEERTIARWVTRAEPGSWHRTCAVAYRQSAEAAIASLRKRTEGRLSALPGLEPSRTTAIPARRLPRVTARAVRRRAQWQRYEEQWLLAVRRRRSLHGHPTDTTDFTLIEPPPERTWADPFLAVGDDGERYVFFEDQPHDTRKGVIACATIDALGLTSEPRTVLERDYHLSYPFVFNRCGDWYMLPESSANRTVELYRATCFPTEWELDRLLWEGAHLTDATPFEHDGRTWIFASSETSTGQPTDSVSLFWAEALTAEWQPHPLNPIVSDVRSSRPGGRIIPVDGRLIRPAQDGSRGYGSALAFMEITRLTTTEYEERCIGRISADRLAGGIGAHHYDADDALEVIDVQRLVRRKRPAADRWYSRRRHERGTGLAMPERIDHTERG